MHVLTSAIDCRLKLIGLGHKVTDQAVTTAKLKQVAPLSLTCLPTFVRTYSPEAGTQLIHNVFITYSQHFTLVMTGIPSSYRVHVWYGKAQVAVRQSGKGHMMTVTVVRAQYINVTDKQTDRHVSAAIAALTQYASCGN